MLSWLTGKSNTSTKFLRDRETIYTVKLIEKENVSHDTRRFRFELPENHCLGLPVGKHISVIAEINGTEVKRSYTPVSSDDDKGHFELVIKIYFKNVHPKFPDGGKLTQHLESLKIGETINISGPKGRLEYHGKGNIVIFKDPLSSEIVQKRQVKKLSLIAGGTGIAPMLQIIRQILKKSTGDNTEIALLFANQTEQDILLRPELEEVATKHPKQFKYWYTLDRPTDEWKYGRGFVSQEMIQEHLHKPADDTMVLMCGPPPMMKFINELLDKLEWPQETRFKY